MLCDAERLKTELEAGGEVVVCGGGDVVVVNEGADKSKRSPIADELGCADLGCVAEGAAGAGDANEPNTSNPLPVEGFC